MTTPAPGDTAELTIEALGAGGDGIARFASGEAVFVPAALPGERVRVRMAGRRGAAGLLGRAEAWLGPASPERADPPCPHFGACGGCALQHWTAAPYLAWKRGRLADALVRSGFPDAPVAEAVATPPGTRRRADLALRREAEGAVRLGFHAAGAETVVDLAACIVIDPRLVALFGPLRAVLRRLGTALRREGSAVLNLLDTGPDLLLRTDGPLDAAGRAALAAFAAAEGLPRIAWARGEGPPETAAQRGPATIRFGTATIAPPPGAFLQASPAAEAAIRAAVLAGLPARLPPRAVVAELFAGVGTLTFALAEHARVAAFEGSAEAVAALAAAAGKAGQGRITATRRDLARQPLLPKELATFAAVVLDPPFAGAPEQMAMLARAAVPRIICVSCNPAALARDAAPLARAGYVVAAATPVDQFLFSPHIEAVVVFSRPPRRGRPG